MHQTTNRRTQPARVDSPNLWNEKPWGRSRHLLITPAVDLALAIGKAGGSSSLHVHHRKTNTFVVSRGVVVIRYFLVSGEEEQTKRLEAGDSWTCPAGIAHRMAFETDAVLHELYTPQPGHPLDLGDIQRLRHGWGPPEE